MIKTVCGLNKTDEFEETQKHVSQNCRHEDEDGWGRQKCSQVKRQNRRLFENCE